MSFVIGVLGGTGRVGSECLRHLEANSSCELLVGGRRTPPAESVPGTFERVDVFDATSLARFCSRCSVLVNCTGPASLVRDRVALTALQHGCHYVDPGGYTPLFTGLNVRMQEIRDRHLTYLLTLGILPGLSEIFPVFVARTDFDRVEFFECSAVGRDRWTYPSAWDIAWGVGNIGHGEAPVYYEHGKRKLAGLLTSARRVMFPEPVGRYTVFRLMRDDLQQFVEAAGIPDAHVYGNNWGHWVSLATVLVRLLRWYGSEKRLDRAARLIMRAAALDMHGKQPGFMLHVRMGGIYKGEQRQVERTLFFEDTYRASGLCAAIGARLVAEGRVEPGVFRAAQMPHPEIFMELFQEQGYAVSGHETSGETACTGGCP